LLKGTGLDLGCSPRHGSYPQGSEEDAPGIHLEGAVLDWSGYRYVFGEHLWRVDCFDDCKSDQHDGRLPQPDLDIYRYDLP